jgi:hypothetical protein
MWNEEVVFQFKVLYPASCLGGLKEAMEMS